MTWHDHMIDENQLKCNSHVTVSTNHRGIHQSPCIGMYQSATQNRTGSSCRSGAVTGYATYAGLQCVHVALLNPIVSGKHNDDMLYITHTANSIIGFSSSGKHNIRPEGASIAAGITSAAAGDWRRGILHKHTGSRCKAGTKDQIHRQNKSSLTHAARLAYQGWNGCCREMYCSF
jgi:hypothetical protein